MSPRANLAHRIPGRVRVRVPSRRKDNEFFQHVERRWLEHDQVQQVEVNVLTGSILFWHESALEPILEFAAEEDLFDLPGRRNTLRTGAPPS